MKRLASFLLLLAVLALLLLGYLSDSTPAAHPLNDFSLLPSHYSAALLRAKAARTWGQLDQAVEDVEHTAERAALCVKNYEQALAQVDGVLKVTAAVKAEGVRPAADAAYFQTMRQEKNTQLADCRLVLFQAKESLIELRKRQQAMSQQALLVKSPSLFATLAEWRYLPLAERGHQSLFASISGLSWLFQGLLVIAALGMAEGTRQLLRRWQTASASLELARIVAALSWYIYGIFPFLFLTFYHALFDYWQPSGAPFVWLSAVLLLLFALLALLRFLLYPNEECGGMLGVAAAAGRRLCRLASFGASIALLGYLLIRYEAKFPHFNGGESLLSLIFVLFAASVFLAFSCQMVRVLRAQQKGFKDSVIYALTLMCLWLFYVAIVVLEIVGYHAMATYLLKATFFTLVAYGAAKALWLLSHRLLIYLNQSAAAWPHRVKRFLGVKFTREITEIYLLHWALCCLVLFGFFCSVLVAWGISENFVDYFISAFFQGVRLLGIHIVPARLLLAIVVFAVLLMLGRSLATHVAHRYQFRDEEDTQVAVATILLYLSFAVAILVALFVLRVDLTGIAIIAGALSVGVGLGLQTIANNFISGLILLLEKPIKPGDRIVIDGVEGFVKKVRIRSTQVSTLSKEDVIVPNADLINQKVTNYMFRDKLWRISCAVGVAYGSDVEKVKATMLAVAAEHPRVIQEQPNAPLVYFRQFADSSLHFELWCVIDDVNKKYAVVSDLHTAIDAAFRAQQITIAFPQRDIHIKSGASGLA